ncbi:cbb3-type cytochrome oxidase assembly protein CcoS [Fodinibius salsisoli]|uniref:Cbb3-type cytochrome oxidase assembly protein CcoS n=1 Tax=Fodinibius salsisoli TaxID=2820877 RepID=A0ABT3PMV7_9BACT|nr:cbb3-type cytochrome oxidase assembly protein CcoS [Fodinibius salsisoli]MCW9707284.1 cbb3-type cytochrome oxidase assembly protein CcoS [Fodinibius salsisoli]
MEVIFILIGCSLLVALLFLGLFFWSVRNGQYDDPHTPAIRILFDNKKSDTENNTTNPPKNTND